MDMVEQMRENSLRQDLDVLGEEIMMMRQVK